MRAEQLRQWCDDGSKLVSAVTASSMNDLACFMDTHAQLKSDEIWTSDSTYVHVVTPSLQVGHITL